MAGKELERVCRELLIAIGAALILRDWRETLRRFSSMWREFVNYDPGTTETTFASASSDQMVCVSGIRVWSICQHHLLPIWADISIGYIATDRILGLSMFARFTQKYAHQLQLQERLCTSSIMRGVFWEKHEARMEFLRLTERSHI
jgi:GTP cyclohydrolase I